MVQESKMVESMIDLTRQLDIKDKDAIADNCKAVSEHKKTIGEVYEDNFPVLDAIAKREKSICTERKKEMDALNAEIRKNKLDSIKESITELDLLKNEDFGKLLAYCFSSSDNVSVSFARVNNAPVLVCSTYSTDVSGEPTEKCDSWTLNPRKRGTFERVKSDKNITDLNSSVKKAIKVVTESFGVVCCGQNDDIFFFTTDNNYRQMKHNKRLSMIPYILCSAGYNCFAAFIVFLYILAQMQLSWNIILLCIIGIICLGITAVTVACLSFEECEIDTEAFSANSLLATIIKYLPAISTFIIMILSIISLMGGQSDYFRVMYIIIGTVSIITSLVHFYL